MNTDLLQAAHHLDKGRLHRLNHAQGLRILALTGCLWVTQDHEDRKSVV